MERSSLESGISIVEICVTILIIAIIAIVITFFTKNNLLMSSVSQKSETAYMAAELKLAELSANPFPVNGSDSYQVNNFTFNRNWVIETVSNVKKATITVTWQSLSKQEQIILTGAIN